MSGTFVAVVGEKGGCAKTTTVVHLARWLRLRGRSVRVIDADPTQRAASRWLAEADPSVEVIVAGTTDDVLEAEAGGVDYVIGDGPAGMAETSRLLLVRADLALLPVGPSVLDLRALADSARLVRQVQRALRPHLRAVVIPSRVQAHVRVSREVVEAAAALGLPVAGSPIPQRAAIADSVGQGTTCFDMGAAGRDAAAAFDALFREVIEDGGT
jgi:chromosome partitioning protein